MQANYANALCHLLIKQKWGSLGGTSLVAHAFALNLQGFSHTQILKHKFKFFTQNLRHFVNSTHFINLSQISSLMQGFFISLPQIFYIFTQIAFKILKNLTQQRINNESQR